MFKTRPYKLSALREWNLRMSRNETPIIFDPVVAHVLREQGFNPEDPEYFEPRSIYSVEKLYQQLESFDPSKTVFVDCRNSHVQRGIAFAYSVFAKPKDLEALHPLKVWDESIISNWKGSAGITAFGQTKREAFSRGILSANRILAPVGEDSHRNPEPCIALTRTGKNEKSRLVWGYPMSMTLIEGMVAKPLLSVLKGGTTPMAFAMTNKTLGLRLLSSSQSKKYYYSLDATQFDSSIQTIWIRIAFSIIRTWFDLSEILDQGRTVGELIDIIEDYFIHTPIVMPTGEREVKGQGILHLGKKHGVPSGSYFTQLVDSIVNVLVLGTLASVFGFSINGKDVSVLGDDLLFFTNSHLDIDSLARVAKELCGINFHGAEKSAHGHSSEPIPFLGRDWVKGVPTRTTTKAIKKMLYPESYRKYGDPRREGQLVAFSYNLSAVQETKLIPNQFGWTANHNILEVAQQSKKLSGLMRFKLRDGYQFKKNSGSVNLLDILNM